MGELYACRCYSAYLDRKYYGKCRSSAHLTFHRDSTAQHIHDFLRYSHSKTGAFSLFHSAVILTGKRIKYFIDKLRIDSDSCVGKGKSINGAIRLLCGAFLNIHGNRTSHGCEFAGIGEDIDKSLSEPQRITVDIFMYYVLQAD